MDYRGDVTFPLPYNYVSSSMHNTMLNTYTNLHHIIIFRKERKIPQFLSHNSSPTKISYFSQLVDPRNVPLHYSQFIRLYHSFIRDVNANDYSYEMLDNRRNPTLIRFETRCFNPQTGIIFRRASSQIKNLST